MAGRIAHMLPKEMIIKLRDKDLRQVTCILHRTYDLMSPAKRTLQLQRWSDDIRHSVCNGDHRRLRFSLVYDYIARVYSLSGDENDFSDFKRYLSAFLALSNTPKLIAHGLALAEPNSSL